MSGLYNELKRRNVFRVAITYALVAWVLLQVADVLFPALSLPDWTIRLVAGLLMLGFPLALFFAWAFELTPEGLKKEHEVDRKQSIAPRTGRKLDFFVISVLAVAVAMFALDKFVWNTSESTASTGSSDNSIAVLPFINMSDDPENVYFSDGISEELLNLLAKIPELRVIGRTSSFQFKGKQLDLRDIGETLQVGSVLKGSVRKSGNTVRITAQLVSTTDAAHIWSDSFDRDLDDIFKVQDEIASAVVDALRVELLGQSIPARSSPLVSEAYDTYLKGLYYFRRLDPNDMETALTYFKQAIALDPNSAVAWQKIGSVYLNQTLSSFLPLDEGKRISEKALDRALEIDPNSAEAHYQTGFRLMSFEWDWQGAEASMQKALAIEPNHSGALSGLGLLRLAMGRIGEAVEYQKRSLRADPLRIASHANLGFVYYKSNQIDLAVQALHNALEYSPSYLRGQFRYAVALLAQGDLPAALAASELESGEQLRLGALAMIYHEMGRNAESESALADIVNGYAGSTAYLIAKVYANRGDADAAFEWLDTAYHVHDPLVPWTRFDPQFVKLNKDPRFADYLERLNVPH